MSDPTKHMISKTKRIVPNDESSLKSRLADVMNYLEKRYVDDKAFISEEDLEKALGFKISDYPQLKSKLEKSDKVVASNDQYKFKAEVEANDKNELIDELRKKRFLLKTQLNSTYKGVDNDLKALEEEKRLHTMKIPATRDKLIFYLDEDFIENRVSSEFQKLWTDRTPLPETDEEFEKELIKRGYQKEKLFPLLRDPYPVGEENHSGKKKKGGTGHRVNAHMD